MDKVAVIGIACQVPGARTPEEFWQNLIHGIDSTDRLTSDDLGGIDPTLFLDNRGPQVDKTYSLKGGFIREFAFDAEGYHLPVQFLMDLDPLFQVSLQVAKQALSDSRYLKNSAALSRCGVILGNLAFPTRSSQQQQRALYQSVVESSLQQLLGHPALHLASMPAGAECPPPENAATFGQPATVIARALALSGLSFCLDAACASSLYAIELACQALQAGQTDLMLSGAVSCADPLFNRMLFSGVQAYPDNGISCPLDRASRGLTPSDGAVFLVLKRWREAVRDGDRIYGLICGAGLSNDGRDKHFLSPSEGGQQLAFSRAYERAQISPQSIDYVECHATGTLLGDTTELAAIEQFFGARDTLPLLGSAKANVGHALTAAGMVGVLKVLLSMQHNTIPPTPRLTEPVSSPQGRISADRIVSKATPWSDNGQVKRAAVSAFGFGGTNAHLILESPNQTPPTAAPTTPPTPDPQNPASLPPSPFSLSSPLAIVGMDAVFGQCNGLDAFERSLFEGAQQFIPLPSDRWKGLEQNAPRLETVGLAPGSPPEGAYISSFEVNPLRFRIPPNEVESLNPQQLLMLKVADRAIQDAGLTAGEKVATIVIMETEPTVHQLQQRWHLPWQIEQGLARANLTMPDELRAQLEKIVGDSLHPPAEVSEFLGYVGNITASRIAALGDFKGPALALGSGENAIAQALTVARLLLTLGGMEAIVIGAVDLAGSAEPVLLRHQQQPVNTGRQTWELDQQVNGWLIGEGAGAVVLKRLEQAQQVGDRIYATLDGLSLSSNFSSSLNANLENISSEKQSELTAQTCQQAHSLAETEAADIGYLEMFGEMSESSTITGLLAVYRSEDQTSSPMTPHCAMGSASATIGQAGRAAGMASLIKTALCLYHRYLPAVPQWSQPKFAAVWKGSPFHVAAQSLPWFLPPATTQRRAAIHGRGTTQSCHLILSEVTAQAPRSPRYLANMPLTLFVLTGKDQADLTAQLSQLEEQLKKTPENNQTVKTIATDLFKRSQSSDRQPYTLSLLAQSKDELRREIQRARQGLAPAFTNQTEWKTPNGSYFTAKPLGPKGKVAFVYPGAFGAYVGIGQQSFRLFPNLYEDELLSEQGLNMAEIASYIYPRSLTRRSARQAEALERKLLEDPIAMLQVETGCAALTTAVLRDVFQLRPDCVFGYSLGETSMIFSQGVWQGIDQLMASFRTSPLFGDRLSGAQTALRDYWQIESDPAQTKTDVQSSLWSAHVLLAAASKVKAAVSGEERVYLTQINTPDEVVIAGDPAACQRVIAALGCQAFRAPFSHLIHCPPMASEYKALAELHRLAVKQRPQAVTFYSAADYEPISLESETIGQAIAKNLCQQFDFPRLVNRVYDEGARLFIEVGAGNTCSRWISRILQGKTHVVESFDKRGMATYDSLVRLLAKLASHQVALDLSSLYPAQSVQSEHSSSLTKTVCLGGPSITKEILSDRHRHLFKDALQVKPVAELISQPAVSQPAVSQPPEPLLPDSLSPDSPPVAPQPVPVSLSQVTSVASGAIAGSPTQEITAIARHVQKLDEQNTQLIETSMHLFETRQRSLSQMEDLISQQINFSKQLLSSHASTPPPKDDS